MLPRFIFSALFALMLTPAVFAAPQVKQFYTAQDGSILQAAGWVNNRVVATSSTVVSDTAPTDSRGVKANAFLVSSWSPVLVCADPGQCDATPPAASISGTGWVPNLAGRVIPAPGGYILLQGSTANQMIAVEWFLLK